MVEKKTNLELPARKGIIKMWRLYGEFRIGYKSEDHVAVVAEFSQQCLAYEYLLKSKLARPRSGAFPFKKASLLAGYHDAYIEFVVDEQVPVDPVFGEKD